MREILFRGKRKDNGEWIEGSLLKVTISGETYYFIFCDDFALDGFDVKALSRAIVDPETIGEYFGLPDKTGKRIFEGDILRYFDDEIQVVEWNDEAHQIMLHTYAEYERKVGRKAVKEKCEGWHYLNDYPLNEMSIIGNIHDNPELLEVSGDE